MSDRPSWHLPPLLRRWHPADLGFMVLAAAAFALLLSVGSRMTFHSDEWNVIAVPPGGTPEGWFAPYNEHWSTVLYLVYRGLNGIVGLRSYLPYIGLLLIVHVVAAGGLYRLLSLATSRWVALAGASILLVLGNAYQDLFWGWQVGFVGSTAAGVWALAALAGAPRPRNAAGAAVLLTVAVATSGIGLAFLGAALVLELARPDRRREVLWLAIPLVAYAAWYGLIGRTAISVNNNPFTVQAAALVPGFVAASVAHAVAATFGLEPQIGAAATALGVTLVALSLAPPTWRPSRLRSLDPELRTIRDGLPIVLAALFGLLVLFSLIGLTRAQRGPDAALEPRYVYPAAVLVLTAVGGAVGQRTVYALSRRSPAVLGAALILAVALAGNLQALETGRQIFLGYADEVRALTALVERYHGAPAVDPNRALWPMPKPAELLALLRREGWPASNPPGDVSGLPPDAVDRALVQLVGSSFSVTPGPARAGADRAGRPPPQPLGWDAYSGMTVTETEGCLAITTKPPHGLLILHVPDGAALSIEGPVGTPFDVSLGRFVDPQPPDARQGMIPASGSSLVLVPRLSDGQPWKLEFGLPASKTWRLCPAALS